MATKDGQKTGGAGHYKPPGKLSPRQAREWLWDHGGADALENRLRRALGQKVKRTGPTGKVTWAVPSEAEQAKAEEWVCSRLLPPISAVSLSGEQDGPPIRSELINRGALTADAELARRVAMMLHLGKGGAEDGLAEGSPQTKPKISEKSERASSENNLSAKKLDGGSAEKFENEISPPLEFQILRFANGWAIHAVPGDRDGPTVYCLFVGDSLVRRGPFELVLSLLREKEGPVLRPHVIEAPRSDPESRPDQRSGSRTFRK
jgi:hypothetical protein